MGNKKKNAIGLYMEGIRDGNPRAAIKKFTGKRYTQHSTGVKDGVEGFIEFFEPFIKKTPKEISALSGRSKTDNTYFCKRFNR